MVAMCRPSQLMPPPTPPARRARRAACRVSGGRAGWGAAGFRVGQVTVEIIQGDARETLPAWQGMADAWFLDGFSPAKNPELWSEALMAEVGRHTAPDGSFATYTAAGHVRRALAAAGFAVERAPGFAGKRHMSRGVKP